MQLVCVLGSFYPDEQGHGDGGAALVDGRVGHADDQHVVLPRPGTRHVGRDQDVQQNVACS